MGLQFLRPSCLGRRQQGRLFFAERLTRNYGRHLRPPVLQGHLLPHLSPPRRLLESLSLRWGSVRRRQQKMARQCPMAWTGASASRSHRGRHQSAPQKPSSGRWQTLSSRPGRGSARWISLRRNLPSFQRHVSGRGSPRLAICLQWRGHPRLQALRPPGWARHLRKQQLTRHPQRSPLPHRRGVPHPRSYR